jgi:hypothetical protein
MSVEIARQNLDRYVEYAKENANRKVMIHLTRMLCDAVFDDICISEEHHRGMYCVIADGNFIGWTFTQQEGLDLILHSVDYVAYVKYLAPLSGEVSTTLKTTCVNLNKVSECDVYIGGWCPSHAESKWANPYPLSLQKYHQHILNSPELLHSLSGLKGKRLGCFCSNELCHGKILTTMVDEFY